MKLVRIPSPNFFTPEEMTENTIAAVVMHGTSSNSIMSAVSWLRDPQASNPGRAVSSNYAISKSGVIYELVPFEKGLRAWANGIVENYDLSLTWLREAVRRRVNPNWITVSIEHEATQFEMENHASMTDAQFNSSIDLTAYILTTCGLKANHQTIVGHGQISGRQKRNCPGVIFPPAYTEVLIDRHRELK
jgi:N-acetyl-anhydromuramyl-L-alanine amidase AmpD